ncbi:MULTISPECIES: TetR/AcrR family transcriptional regulator [unclassified Rhizobium]|uniref:TetR/AcrR family transcriptional regulator n=1 Tax=Rhizobium TaxID=379 RepID=UPI00084C7710|nr:MULTISPECIES: TetR/AcrR family transcriptional regulator [unclassified Rhizobium]OED01314.1 TetR family transcriptional regulator [Rhizobium sp. YK2]QYA15626.1 TetR family transcriptional regulator [Rhizobium sp. AB2/73]UEQ83507.1 TetR family transcriptional regulator [Rhizobium sp. AB2/73]
MARTRAVDFEEKQRGILASAAAVFAEVGMEKASMSMIASHGNVSKALLYHYYPGKDALIFDIVQTHLTELESAIEAADRTDVTPQERLRLLVKAVLKNYEGADNEHKVQLNGTHALSQEQLSELRTIERRIVKRFSSVIHDLNPDLNKKKPLLMPVTMSLFGMMNWVYMWFRPNGPITRDEYANIATTLILEGVKAVR